MRLTGSVVGLSGSQLQAVAEARGVDVIRRHGSCVRCPILREKTSKSTTADSVLKKTRTPEDRKVCLFLQLP